jgi:hypothetical protein
MVGQALLNIGKSRVDPHHEYILFELFNEPVKDNCPESDSITNEIWVNDYVIPAIQGIKYVEKDNGGRPHYIIPTTWGNWSGVHDWIGDGTLEYLLNKLDEKKLDTENYVLIAGHQYCDVNYSGGANGCDKDKFSIENQDKWLELTDKSMSNNRKFKWILTEGNITNSANGEFNNIPLWKEWIKKLKKNDYCVGSTVWVVPSQVSGGINGMWDGVIDGGGKGFEIYSKIYNTQNGKYTFDDGVI